MAANAVVLTYPATWNMQQLQMSNCVFSLTGVYFPYFAELDYSDNVEVEEGKGNSPYPMGTTTGMYKASGSISVQLVAAEQFLTIIQRQSPANNSIYDAVFPLTVQWQLKPAPNYPSALPNPVITHELLGCRITGEAITGQSGAGVMLAKYPLYIGLIRRNGRLPLAGLLSG